MMKRNNIKWLMLSAMAVLTLNSCSDDWDDHYENTDIVVNNPSLQEVKQTSQEFLSESADYSRMYDFLKNQGLFDQLEAKDLLHTLLVVKNDDFGYDWIEEGDTAAIAQLAKSHLSDIALPPSNLHDGDRIMMWHQKFVSVAIDTAVVSTDVSRISLGGNSVKEIIKTSNGYIYVIDGLIYTPKSLKDLIDGLSDEYSIFKQLVLSSGGQEFDRVNSKPIGVDATGNTIYDSVFIYTNEFFDAKNFNLSSESLTATMLVFSDEVINKAMQEADEKLKAWNQNERDREKLRNWILEVAFFNKRYTPEEMGADAANHISSIYNRQWRTEVQSVDVDNMEEVSNGVVYYVTDFKIPHNVLMYRLKDFYYYYENCDDIDKNKYYVATNLTGFSCSTDVPEWTPLEGVWPKIEDRALNAKIENTEVNGFTLDFTLLKRTLTDEGVYEISPYKIPPGTYRLAMGFKQNLGLEMNISVLVNGKPVCDPATILAGTTTTYHYDRGNTLSNCYPEGYKEIMSTLSHSKKGNYDTDGGPVFDEITIPDVNGDGSASEVVLRIENTNLSGKTSTMFHHWCLRPTEDNY